MKNTRRTFLQSLAPVPLLGWVATPAKPAMPSLPPVRVDASEPVYGFDERLMLSDIHVDVWPNGSQSPTVFYFGEKVKCGDLVTLNSNREVVIARENQHPIGIVTAPANAGDEAQYYVLVRGRVT